MRRKKHVRVNIKPGEIVEGIVVEPANKQAQPGIVASTEGMNSENHALIFGEFHTGPLEADTTYRFMAPSGETIMVIQATKNSGE